jgi:hypothetical protein
VCIASAALARFRLADGEAWKCGTKPMKNVVTGNTALSAFVLQINQTNHESDTELSTVVGSHY